jgi:hypothetical protein
MVTTRTTLRRPLRRISGSLLALVSLALATAACGTTVGSGNTPTCPTSGNFYGTLSDTSNGNGTSYSGTTQTDGVLCNASRQVYVTSVSNPNNGDIELTLVATRGQILVGAGQSVTGRFPLAIDGATWQATIGWTGSPPLTVSIAGTWST